MSIGILMIYICIISRVWSFEPSIRTTLYKTGHNQSCPALCVKYRMTPHPVHIHRTAPFQMRHCCAPVSPKIYHLVFGVPDNVCCSRSCASMDNKTAPGSSFACGRLEHANVHGAGVCGEQSEMRNHSSRHDAPIRYTPPHWGMHYR